MTDSNGGSCESRSDGSSSNDSSKIGRRWSCWPAVLVVAAACALVPWSRSNLSAKTEARISAEQKEPQLMDVFKIEKYVWRMFSKNESAEDGRDMAGGEASSAQGGADAADPGVGYRHLVDQQRHKLAACLDGSPPSFYLRRAPPNSPNASKWFLYFQGGGTCNFWKPKGSLFNCHARRKTQLGSSSYDEASRDFSYKTVFSQDPNIAVTWHDWNVVLLRYCDGHNWASALQEPVVNGDQDALHFRGVFNVEALLHTLVEDHGMAGAQDIVAYGCSSGAVAVTVNADRIRRVVPATAFLSLVADSAFYPDFSPEEEADGHRLFVPTAWAARPTPGHAEKSYWRMGALHLQDPLSQPAPATFRAHALYGKEFVHHEALDEGCLEALSANNPRRVALYLCSHVVYALPHVEAPLFLLNSKFDGYIVRLEGVQPQTEQKRAHAEADINLYGQQLVGAVKQKVTEHERRHPGSPLGVLVDSCLHHCEWWGYIRYESGRTNAEEFAQWHAAARAWWQRGSTGAPPRLVRIQDEIYPCKDCCITHWNTSVEQWLRLNGGRAS